MTYWYCRKGLQCRISTSDFSDRSSTHHRPGTARAEQIIRSLAGGHNLATHVTRFSLSRPLAFVSGAILTPCQHVEDQPLEEGRFFKTHCDQIVQHGQVRHLPGGVYWEEGCGRDQYQNGGYWATPVGWFVYTLDLADHGLADRTVLDMVDHFKQHGACEWIIGESRQLPNYLASAALPLDGIRAMLKNRQKTHRRL